MFRVRRTKGRRAAAQCLAHRGTQKTLTKVGHGGGPGGRGGPDKRMLSFSDFCSCLLPSNTTPRLPIHIPITESHGSGWLKRQHRAWYTAGAQNMSVEMSDVDSASPIPGWLAGSPGTTAVSRPRTDNGASDPGQTLHVPLSLLQVWAVSPRGSPSQRFSPGDHGPSGWRVLVTTPPMCAAISPTPQQPAFTRGQLGQSRRPQCDCR